MSSYARRRAKDYYYANRERILSENRVKVECQCGCVVSKSSLLPHLQTSKHKNYMTLCTNKLISNDDYIILKRGKRNKKHIDTERQKVNFIVSFD